MDNKNKYYTYVYLDTRKEGVYKYGEYEFSHEPFYVGKGSGKRYLFSTHKYNTYLMNKINKINIESTGTVIHFVSKSLSEQDAFDLEIKLISLIGRKDKKSGPLLNHTDGGDGMSGYKISQETQKKKEASFKKTINAEGYIDPRIGRKFSKEHIAKVIASNLKTKSGIGYINPSLGRKHSKEHIVKYTSSRAKTVGAIGYVNPNTGKKRPKGANEKMLATRKKNQVAGYISPLSGKKRPKDVIERCASTYKKNRELKIEELYQSIINLIIRKEKVICGL